MSERSIEVPGPDQPPPEAGADSPYKNLLVPLVVVPFMVVGVLVLVFLFFGAIAGHESSLEENLERVVRGGANESKQAAMSLSSQAAENARARAAGEPEPWPAGAEFAAKLAKAWTEIDDDPDQDNLRLAIAQLAALYAEPGAFDKLRTFLAYPEDRDPEGRLRFHAMMALTWLDDARAAEQVIPFLQHPDAYLRQNAAAVLQKMPGEPTIAALQALLDDPLLELRGQAAISLSRLGDAGGAEVLLELLVPANYAAANTREPKKYASEKVIQDSRRRALEALVRLQRDVDRPVLERLAHEDDDPLVREAAMRAIAERN